MISIKETVFFFSGIIIGSDLQSWKAMVTRREPEIKLVTKGQGTVSVLQHEDWQV